MRSTKCFPAKLLSFAPLASLPRALHCTRMTSIECLDGPTVQAGHLLQERQNHHRSLIVSTFLFRGLVNL
jgi:hypothetical protein